MTRFILMLPVFCALAQSARGNPLPAKPDSPPTEKVDRLFSRWDQRTTPGCVLAVVKDGKIVYRRGYGMANLEHNIPIQADTLFPIASVSKQFTAFAIHLLARDKKLSLDDDVRKYVPELHDFGKTITLRHLIHHTSGLRDQALLMWLGGWRFEDVVTEEDALRVILKQRELNFPPGEEELYSNTGYVLLAEIVKRVSGRSLHEFARERIFQPLGMRHTFFQDDYRSVIINRASPYQPTDKDGYQNVSLSDSTVGQTGVVTTVGDLALWDRNFEEGRVGGKELISDVLKRGRLNNGKEGTYAAGLGIREYRGLPTVEHTGANPGYSSHYARFPGQRFSVMILSNAADMDTAELAHRVADVYLEGKLRPVPAPAAAPAGDTLAEVKIDPKLPDRYVGDYEFKPGEIVAITKDNDRLMAQGTGSGRVPLYALSESRFFLKNSAAQLSFVKPEGADGATSLILHQKGGERTAKRIDSAPLTDYVGEFHSGELNVWYAVTLRGGKLYLRYPRGEMEMVRTFPDTFESPFPMGTLRYVRGENRACNGFTVDNGRVRNLRFRRAKITLID